MKYQITHDGITKTYSSLLSTAHHLLDLAKESGLGRSLNLQASAVFHAFAFEAYLNHVGAHEIAFWEQIDRLPYKRKLNIIGTQLGLDINLGQEPFQVVGDLFALRNMLAHGRTVEINETYETDTEPEHFSAWRIHEWEKLTIDIVDGYQANIRDAIKTINQARPVPDDDFDLWNRGGRGRTVKPLINE